jgi:hypothetical protein
MTEEQKATRTLLMKRSVQVRPLVESGKYETVNEAIITLFYMNEGNLQFNKFKQWLEMGYKVKKGSKGFPVWAKPLKALKADEPKPKEPIEGENFNGEYFPICYLFSNLQVEKK